MHSKTEEQTAKTDKHKYTFMQSTIRKISDERTNIHQLWKILTERKREREGEIEDNNNAAGNHKCMVG